MSLTNNSEISEIKRQIKTQKLYIRVLMILWLVTISVGLLGATFQKANFIENLRVGRLALVDSNGVERVILVNNSESVRVAGKTYPRKPVSTGIIFQNEKGDEMAGWAMGENGQTVFMIDGYSDLTSFGESERVGLVSMPDGTAGLYLFDLKGNLRASLTSDSSLNSKFSMSDESGSTRIEGKVESNGISDWKITN